MSDEQVQKLLQGAVRAAKNGDKELARRAFLQVTKLQPDNEAGWLGLATSAQDKKEQLLALRHVLEINPNNQGAIDAVQRLGLDPARLLATGRSADTPPQPEPVDDTVSDEPEHDADEPAYLAEEETQPRTNFPYDEPGEVVTLPLDSKQPIPSEDEVEDALPEWMRDREAPDTDLGDVPEWLNIPNEYDETPPQTPSWLEGLDEEMGYTAPPPADEPVETPSQDLFGEDVDDETDDTDSDPFDGISDDEEAEVVDYPEYEEYASEPEPEPEPEYTLDELFAMRKPPVGQPGTVPRIPRDQAEQAAERADAIIMAYLNDELTTISPEQWTRKRRGRAGEREVLILRAQIGAVALVILGVIGFAAYQAVLNIPELRQIAFAPTATITPSPTLTPTNTPGVTPTPSSTPEQTYTPSPTLDPSVTPGRTGEPPTGTPPFVSFGNPELRIRQANDLIEAGEYTEALELLEEEIRTTRGNFIPYYYKALVLTLQENFSEARQVIDDGVQQWQDIAADAFYEPMVDTAYGRVNVEEAEELLVSGNAGQANTLLDEAREQLQNAVDLRPDNIDGYMLLSKSYRLVGQNDEALELLDGAINRDLSNSEFQTYSLFTNASLRMEQARILYDEERYTDALQALDELLRIEPFLQEALRLQVQTALDANRPGDAVLFAEEYLFRYPNSVEGFRLLGTAHMMENKPDLALIDYSNALDGNPDDPAYVDVLISRGDLYYEQRAYEQAFTDYSSALDRRDNPEVRVRRLESALALGNYDTVLEDARELSGQGFLPQGELDFLQARVLIEQDGDYGAALSLLESALANGVPNAEFGLANQYLAQARFEADDYAGALSAVDNALGSAETGTRHYLKAQILEALAGEAETPEESLANYTLARDEYAFIVTWSTIYPYTFADTARERYDELAETIADLQQAIAEAEEEEA